jgi:hypothetical protein
MALQAGEVRGPGGYIFDAAGLPVFTTDTTGATMQRRPAPRDPDGRLVVVYV